MAIRVVIWLGKGRKCVEEFLEVFEGVSIAVRC